MFSLIEYGKAYDASKIVFDTLAKELTDRDRIVRMLGENEALQASSAPCISGEVLLFFDCSSLFDTRSAVSTPGKKVSSWILSAMQRDKVDVFLHAPNVRFLQIRLREFLDNKIRIVPLSVGIKFSVIGLNLGKFSDGQVGRDSLLTAIEEVNTRDEQDLQIEPSAFDCDFANRCRYAMDDSSYYRCDSCINNRKALPSFYIPIDKGLKKQKVS